MRFTSQRMPYALFLQGANKEGLEMKEAKKKGKSM